MNVMLLLKRRNKEIMQNHLNSYQYSQMKITKSKRTDMHSDVNFIKCEQMCKNTGKLKTLMLLVRLISWAYWFVFLNN